MSSGVDTLLNESDVSTERLQLAQFLSILWPTGCGDQWCNFWGAPSRRSHWASSINDELHDHLLSWAKTEDVYMGCGLHGQNFGPNQRGDRDTVTAIPGLWLDLDVLGDQHKKKNLPPTEADALALLKEMGLPPSIIIHSGHGLQAWWLFREPWMLDSEEERVKAERLTKGWCDTLRVKAKAHGWDADQVGDLARVMRLPGLWNRKGIPKRTQTLSSEAMSRYNPTDCEAYLAADVPAPRTALKIGWAITKRDDAEPPSAKFLLLYENEPDFRRLCRRIPQQGQADTSPSGFDFQLTLLAFAAGWTAQEIVDLLIAQRRAHHADLKLDHPSYYETTLSSAVSSAVSGKDEQSRARIIEDLKAGAHSSDIVPAASSSTIADPPTIDAGVQDLPTITELSWRAIERANDPPRLFLFGEVPSRLELSDDGSAKPKGLTLDLLRHETARAARWFRREKNKETGQWQQRDAKPPMDVIRDMLASPVIPLPHLVRLVETPVFGRHGTLLHAPGYHATDGLYYAAARALTIPPVPSHPTPAHRQDAMRLLLDEFLHDFPFVNESSRAHALGCLLLPFVRDLIDGPTPLHLIEKPTPRTGGTLLAAMLVLPAVGKSVIHLTEANDNDNWKKAITAVLRGSPISVCIDNIRRRLESSHLASAITATTWTDRVLGFSENISLPVRPAWLATGNNPLLSDEMQSRTVLVRLDAHFDRPEDRGGFRHALPAWAMEHRGELIHAALVLCQAWITAGRPPGDVAKGGFESWSAVIGGILTHAQVPGFLRKQNNDLIDPDAQQWLIFLRLWWDRYKAVPVGVSELFQIVEPHNDEPLDLGLGDGSERSQKVRLGHRLIERRDRQFSVEPEYRLQIVAGKLRSRAQLWQLKMVRQEPAQVNVVNVSECFPTHHNGVRSE